MGRYVAKSIVAAGLATSAEIQFAYAIGHPDPVSVCINTFGTGVVSDEDIDYVLETFPQIVAKLRAMSPTWEEFQRRH